jgi:hypothetical protein
MRFLWLGVSPSLDRALTSACNAALYCFTIKHAIAVGCTEANLMYCKLGLDNGIHRYKRKLGARVCNDWALGQLLVRVTRMTPAVASFLQRMPFAVAGSGDRLRGRVLVCRPNLTVTDVGKIAAYHACRGLEHLTIVSTEPLAAAVRNADYEPLDPSLPSIELRDLSASRDPAVEFCRA